MNKVSPEKSPRRRRAHKVVAQFDLKPDEMYKVKLGHFHKSEPVPRFAVRCHPAQEAEAITHRDSPLEHDNNTYTLFRHFQNYGERPITVTVEIPVEDSDMSADTERPSQFRDRPIDE